jgi:hypothetical protein
MNIVTLDNVAIFGALVAIGLRWRQDYQGSLLAAVLSSVCSIAAYLRRFGASDRSEPPC